MKIIFDVLHLYYLPQYLPVYKALKQRNIDVEFVFYKQPDPELDKICQQAADDNQLTCHFVEDWTQALAYYLSQKADWLVFGNKVKDLEQLHAVSQTVLMQHGIGPKACYYEVSEQLTSIRFVEGQHRLNRLQNLYPDGHFADTGYAKLDPIINQQGDVKSLEQMGLDSNKKTILYAPTFYPSSIGCFPKSFADDFADYNIILKPHFFSLTKKQYHEQRALLNHWAKSKNVYLAPVSDYNLVAFMGVADIMLSDASSAIFEFAALEKPVVWCDFYKLRWSYRGIFSFRFKKRIDSDIGYFHDVALQAKNYQELKSQVKQAFSHPFARRKQVIAELAGTVDGQCSERIADFLTAS